MGIYQDQKQPEKALAAVRRTLARSPKNPQLHQLLGELLLVQKQPQAAIAPLEEALNLNPRQMSALQLLALAYQQMPDADQALQQLEAKAGDPKSSPIFSLVLATVYERQQKVDQAINLYNSLLARNLFTSLARNNLAFLMAEHRPTADNLARAQKLSAETLEDNPEEPGFLDTMGWVLCKQEKYAQAKTYLEKASEHAPGQPAMLYHLAWCEAKLGDTAAGSGGTPKGAGQQDQIYGAGRGPKAAGQSPRRREIVRSRSATGWENPCPTGGETPIASEAGDGGVFCLSRLTVILPEPKTPPGHLKALARLDPFFRKVIHGPSAHPYVIKRFGLLFHGARFAPST